MPHQSTKPQPVPATSGLKPQVVVEAIELPDGRLLDVKQMLVDSKEQYRKTRLSHNLLTLVDKDTSDTSVKVNKKPRHARWTIEQCQRIYELDRENNYYQICHEFNMLTILQAEQLAARARAKLRTAGLIGFLPRGPQKQS
jgi:hypothetical protein